MLANDAQRAALHATIDQLLISMEDEAAATLLAAQGAQLATHAPQALLLLLNRLPASLRTSPHLLSLQGLAHVATGKYAEAITSFQDARLGFLAQGMLGDALRVNLELVRLYHLCEELGQARLYTQLAADLLQAPTLDDAGLAADALLRIATLAPDIGMYAQGTALAQQALRSYEQRGDLAGACDALLLLFSFHNQTGQYQDSASYLHMARHLQASAQLGPRYAVAILNKDAHWHWYQGMLAPARALAQRAILLADQNDQQKQRVYNRLVAGNIARAMGDAGAAEAWYAETEQLAEEIGFTLFLCWIDVQRAWLALLQGEYAPARQLLQRALQTQDYGQAMSFSVFLAVLYGLTDRHLEATEVLERSLAFYQASNDPLSVCAIRLHLAANYLAMARAEDAAQALTAALGWMADRRIDYLPHWWHPAIMTRLCIHALEKGIYANTAEVMLVKHLGKSALSAVQPLLHSAEPPVRRRALDVLEAIEGDPLSMLGVDRDLSARAVLSALLTSGQTAAEGLVRLSDFLATAAQRPAPNPTIMAIFGLYVHGATRKAIAAQLHLSEQAVRNYINYIYRVFGLPYEPAQRRERREELHKRALEAGFITVTAKQK